MFQASFFNLVCHGILHQRLDKPPFQHPQNFPGILVPPHVSMQPEVPANDGWQEIVHHPVSHHLGWPTVSLPLPPSVNPNAQIAHDVSPVQSSHANKRLKTDIPQLVKEKGKATVSPPVHPQSLLNRCLHVST
jgi:hypothetical protein